MVPTPRPPMLGLSMAAAIALGAAPISAGDTLKDDEDFRAFVVGDYVLVGRKPLRHGGGAYSGTVRIEPYEGGRLLLRRWLDGKGEAKARAIGRFEVPSPPGEGRVLRFRWPRPFVRKRMTCLVGADLDNYARLTCTYVWGATAPDDPGFEAMFAKKPR